ncbi:metallophosphoesterase [Niabella terrae]
MKKLVVLLALQVFILSHCYTQEVYQKPKLDHRDSWSVILLPDIQNYVKWSYNQPILDLMMAWIEHHIDSLNIRLVLHTGDIVEENDLFIPADNGNLTAQKQWEFAHRAFSRLDGKVAYMTALGNHDFSFDANLKRSSRFGEFFKIDDNPLNRKALVQNGWDESGQPSLQNSVYELKSVNGGKDMLFMTVENMPRDTTLGWARRITALPQYKDHRVVLLTHAYLTPRDTLWSGAPRWIIYEPYVKQNKSQKSERYLIPNANNGKQIWEKLVQPATNIEMVLCGHINGEGYRADKNLSGKTVHQMLFDMQMEGGGHLQGNGGDGWLRILEFYPDDKTVKVKTFSPLFAASPSTRHLAWKKDKRNEYSFQLN